MQLPSLSFVHLLLRVYLPYQPEINKDKFNSKFFHVKYSLCGGCVVGVGAGVKFHGVH